MKQLNLPGIGGMVQGLVMQAMASGQLARMPAQAGPMFTLYLRAIGGAR